jgi:hypothetical protein
MIYVQIGEAVAKYEGMSIETVQKMLTEQDISFVVIDEQTYFDCLAALENK